MTADPTLAKDAPELDPARITMEAWLNSDLDFRRSAYVAIFARLSSRLGPDQIKNYELCIDGARLGVQHKTTRMLFVLVPGHLMRYAGLEFRTESLLLAEAPLTQRQFRKITGNSYVEFLIQEHYLEEVYTPREMLYEFFGDELGPKLVGDDFPMLDLNPALWLEICGSFGGRFPKASEWVVACQFEEGPLESMSDYELNSYGWTSRNSNESLQKVMSLRPNQLGLFDLLGNVEEIADNDVFEEDLIIERFEHFAMGGCVVLDFPDWNPEPLFNPMRINKSNSYTGLRVALDFL